MDEAGIVPEIISSSPKNAAKVTYGAASVNMGNELTPTQVCKKPSVSWPADQGSLYTLIMTDIDIPPPYSPKVKEVQHWLVFNIPGSDVEKGETFYEYVGSGPPEGSGLHRYIFLVYKQEKKLNRGDYSDMEEKAIENRLAHNHRDLIARLQLKELVAGNFYRAQYDDYVPKLQAEITKRFEKK